MCRFKSGILLKDRVYISDGDSHSDMLEELGIKDTQQNAERVFVRAELYPEDGDVFSPIDQWRWNVDQDILPDWYVEEYEKQRFAEAVKKWAEQHILIGKNGLKLTTGRNYYLKDCKSVELSGDCFVDLLESSQVGTMRGSSQVGTMWESSQVGEMWGSSQVGTMWESSQVGTMRGSSQVGEMWGSSQVGEMWESSQVGTMWESSQVGTMWESSRVGEMWESSQVGTMWGSSQVGEMWENSIASISPNDSNGVSVSSIRLCDNTTVKDNRTKTIYQAGDWKLVLVDQG